MQKLIRVMTSFRQREWQFMRFNYILLVVWQFILQSVRFLIETSTYENPHISLPPVSKNRNMRDKSRFSVKYPTLSCIASSRVYPSYHSRPQSRQNQIHSYRLVTWYKTVKNTVQLCVLYAVEYYLLSNKKHLLICVIYKFSVIVNSTKQVSSKYQS